MRGGKIFIKVRDDRFLGGYINKKQLLQIKVVFFVLIGAGATVYEAGRPSLLPELDPGFSPWRFEAHSCHSYSVYKEFC